jgi:hypothetical protein
MRWKLGNKARHSKAVQCNTSEQQGTTCHASKNQARELNNTRLAHPCEALYADICMIGTAQHSTISAAAAAAAAAAVSHLLSTCSSQK